MQIKQSKYLETINHHERLKSSKTKLLLQNK